MPKYKYLVPLISVSPPPGYQLVQSIDVDGIGALLDQNDAKVRVSQTVILNEREIAGKQSVIEYRGGKSVSRPVQFKVDALKEDGWSSEGPLSYLETHVVIEGDGNFTDNFQPSNYTIYCGPGKKSFFSDNSLKYGNVVTIFQIQAFGAWVEGYPISVVDPLRDCDESVVLINPFLRPAVVDVTLEGIEKKQRFRVEPQTGRRISLAKAFNIGNEGWSGQVFVSGRNRLVMYSAKHSLSDPSIVTTLEHSNPYRGEPTHVPITQVLRKRVGEAISSYFRA